MPKKKKQPLTPPDTQSQAIDWLTYEGDTWPEGHEHWTHEDYVAHVKAMLDEDARRPPPTAEELAAARHMRDKMASASSMYQRDPNAPSEAP